MAKSVTLSDAIRAKVPASTVRSLTWFHRLDAATAEELSGLKADWKSGRLPGSKHALARAIVDELHTRGLSDIGLNGVTAWLRKD